MVNQVIKVDMALELDFTYFLTIDHIFSRNYSQYVIILSIHDLHVPALHMNANSRPLLVSSGIDGNCGICG